MFKKLITVSLALAFIWPALAQAQTNTVAIPTITPIPSAVAEGITAAILGLFGLGLGLSLIVIVIVGIIGLVWLAIWIWALIDLLSRKFEANQQVIWIVLMIVAILIPFVPYFNALTFATWLIPILYLIIGRPQGQKK